MGKFYSILQHQDIDITFFLFLRILSSLDWSACPGVMDHQSLIAILM